MLHSKRILVSGCAGAIGSALIWALRQREIDHVPACDLIRLLVERIPKWLEVLVIQCANAQLRIELERMPQAPLRHF